jgi:hypothetical protein
MTVVLFPTNNRQVLFQLKNHDDIYTHVLNRGGKAVRHLLD